ncbi:MAG: hypothetical protein ABIE03_03510 [Patescibacteria group bacterium]|nr:hypothetical protein [Patescibacteria group bacterium]
MAELEYIQISRRGLRSRKSEAPEVKMRFPKEFKPGTRGVLSPSERIVDFTDNIPVWPIYGALKAESIDIASLPIQMKFGAAIQVLTWPFVPIAGRAAGIIIQDIVSQRCFFLSDAFSHMLGPLSPITPESIYPAHQSVEPQIPHIRLLEAMGHRFDELLINRDSSLDIVVDYLTRYWILAGRDTGARLLLGVLGKLMLHGEVTPPHKTSLFRDITAVLIRSRTRRVHGSAYTTLGLVDKAAKQLDIHPTLHRQLYMSMRAEFVLQTILTGSPYQKEYMLGCWSRTLLKLFHDYSTYPQYAPVYIQDEEMAWEIETILKARNAPEFYRLLASWEARTRATIIPREVEAIHKFYRFMNRPRTPLTFMEQIVLKATVQGVSLDDIAEQIKNVTGVNVDGACISTYRTMLLLGEMSLEP